MMDIFEELAKADAIKVNGVLTDDYGWDALSDDNAHWRMTAHTYTQDSREIEHYHYKYDDFSKAIKYGTYYRFPDKTTMEFFQLKVIE